MVNATHVIAEDLDICMHVKINKILITNDMNKI